MIMPLCSGTTCGTCELYGADNGVLGVDELEAFEVEFAYLEGLAEAEVVDVDYHAFGYLGVGSLYFELLHRELELLTGFHTFGVAFELHGYFQLPQACFR